MKTTENKIAYEFNVIWNFISLIAGAATGSILITLAIEATEPSNKWVFAVVGGIFVANVLVKLYLLNRK